MAEMGGGQLEGVSKIINKKMGAVRTERGWEGGVQVGEQREPRRGGHQTVAQRGPNAISLGGQTGAESGWR